jgi:DNA mismatch repair protein MutS
MDYANTKTLFYYINTYSRIKMFPSDQISNYYIDCQLIENKPTRISSKGWSEIKVGRILFDKEVK